MTTIVVTNAIRSFTEVESRFGLTRSLDPDFFAEWQQSFENLTQLFLADFLDAPFSLRSEEAIEIVDQDHDTVYFGFKGYKKKLKRLASRAFSIFSWVLN